MTVAPAYCVGRTESVGGEALVSGEGSGQWGELRSLGRESVVSRLGIEPRTHRLRVCCSAN